MSAREVGVARELGDAQLLELEGSEVLRVVVERCLHAADEAIEVEVVRRVIEYLERDILPFVFSYRVACRHEGHAKRDRRRGPVVEEPPPGLAPFADQIARRHRDLI